MIQPITYEQWQLMSISNTGSCLDLIRPLNEMCTYLKDDERKLKDLTDGTIAKLSAMTDVEFSILDLVSEI